VSTGIVLPAWSFAFQILPDLRFPDLVIDDDKTIADSFVLPDDVGRNGGPLGRVHPAGADVVGSR
jgi:hypothetical protein